MKRHLELARELVCAVTIHSISEHSLGKFNEVIIRSVGTEKTYRQVVALYLEWRYLNGLSVDAPKLLDDMCSFLRDVATTNSQSSLNQYRQALQKTFSVKLPNIPSFVDQILRGRSYTNAEILNIFQHLSVKHTLPTALVFDCGLRASETFEIRLPGSQSPTSGRPWREDLFVGRKHLTRTVTKGKGGLVREIAHDSELFDELMRHVRPEPIKIRDREVFRTSYFNIRGGQALSQSFCRASKVALGFSLGLHGLRHAYAQRRLASLLELNVDIWDCLQIVSQELGHFRPSISLTYLTKR
jgi:integrase